MSSRVANVELPARFSQTARRVEEALAADLDGWLCRAPGTLGEAIRYAVMGPGKRIRPVLVLWAAEVCGPASDQPDAGEPAPVARCALPAAVAIEMVHAYSLVHDDLPGMDNDELRRGRPTCHVAFGEGLAILAGDALLTRSFEVLASAELPGERVAALVRLLADAAGACGMVGGQAEDLGAEQGGGDMAAVEYIHEHKTACLFAAACRMGAVSVGAGPADELALGRFGRCLGMAFQIVDDLLDETGQTEQLGKRAGKDRSAGKLTYPSVAGLEGSRAAAVRWVDQAEAALDGVSGPDLKAREDLRLLARYILERGR